MQEHWLCSRSKINSALLRHEKLDIYEPAQLLTVVAEAERITRTLQNDTPKLGKLLVVEFVGDAPARIVAEETTAPDDRSNPSFSSVSPGDSAIENRSNLSR
jgi:hypothetical protein